MRIGLLIVGPLKSSGISGRWAHLPKASFPDDLMVSYDATENIHQLVLEGRDKFATFYYVPGDHEGEEIKLSDLHVIAQGRAKEDVTCSAARRYLGNISRGLKSISEEAVFVIRSDQFVDFSKLDFVEKSLNFIYVPRIRKDFLEVSDFYFFAKTELLAQRIDEILNSDSVNCNIHRAFWKSRANYLWLAPVNFLPYPHNALKAQMWQAKRGIEDLRPLPIEIYRSVRWRGSFLSESHCNEVAKTYYFEGDLVEPLFYGYRQFLHDTKKLLLGSIELLRRRI